MRTKTIVLSVSLFGLSMFCSNLSLAGSPHKVESHGVTLHVLQEAMLEKLHSGKYRMRATEITVEPGHVLSTSTYPGPSMAYIFEGTVVSIEHGIQHEHRAGEGAAALESGRWRYKNEGDSQLRLVIFELIASTQASVNKKDVANGKGHVMLDKEIDIPKTGQKLILVHGTIEPGGSAGEHTHQGSEMRLLLAGSLTMTMPEKTVTYRKGQYFFEPAHTHMTKVEGDRSTPTEFIIFEVGTATDVDSVYHPES